MPTLNAVYDLYRPACEPAGAIYDAFQKEAAHRSQQRPAEWIEAERAAVFREACYQAKTLGLREPTMQEVMSAETCAMGHVDYASKWALYVAQGMCA